MKDSIVCDIDMTICCSREKELFKKYKKEIEKGYYGWFKEYVNTFEPAEYATYIIDLFASRYNIIFLTARNELLYKETKKWIDSYFSFRRYYPPKYFFRKDGDSRKDHIIKREFFVNDILPKYKVIAFLDDKYDNIVMAQKLGITCLKVYLPKKESK
jgi:hypothetical protein